MTVDFASREPTATVGVWRIGWTIANHNSEEVRVHGAWLPHGKFRSPRQEFDPALVIAPQGEVQLTFPVSAAEVDGTVVENCFVILSIEWNGGEWRVFARLTVTFADGGTPFPETQLITTQRIGFSA